MVVVPEPSPRSVTQARHPWRATLRTIFAAALPLVPMLPVIVAASGIERYAWAGGIVAAMGVITRVMAVPGVNAWLSRWVPPLAASPAAPTPGSVPPPGVASPSAVGSRRSRTGYSPGGKTSLTVSDSQGEVQRMA